MEPESLMNQSSGPDTLQSVAQPGVAPKPVPVPPQKRKRTSHQKATDASKSTGNRNQSEVWQHFTVIQGKTPIRAACNYCGADYAACRSNNGTTNLHKHLQKQCTKVPWKQEVEKGQRKVTDYSSLPEKGNKSKTLNVNDIRKKLAKMVIIDELPFNIVEGKGFKDYSHTLEPRFKIPSRVTLARDCMKLYGEEKRKLKKALNGRRLCLTTDTWTSLQNLNYMVLTAHYIDDDWVLNKKILKFCTIESHKGAMIASKIEDCLDEWGLDKILTLTVDNASSNDLCVQELIREFKFKDVILDNKFFHVRCGAHILNLVVQDGLNEHFDAIVRVRNACKYVRSSPARMRSFKQCVEKEKIDLGHLVILDVDTRWNSTYLMLDRAGKYEKVFDRLYRTEKLFQDYFDCYDEEDVCNEMNFLGRRRGKKKDKKIIGPPKKDDWIVAMNFVAFLQIFYNVTLKFSSTSQCTSNIFVPELCNVKQTIDSKMSVLHDSSMFSMAMSMQAKFNKYWSNWSNFNHLCFVAIVFDPRLKMRGVHICLSKLFATDVESKKKDIENHLYALFSHYSMNLPVNDKSGCPKNVGEKTVGDGEDIYSMLAREDDNLDCGNELAQYLSVGLEKGDNLNVLDWWKLSSPKYPVMSSIAKDILAIPISTVASEQAFSTSGRVIDPFRSSLSPKTVEALVCAQNWLRDGPPVDIWETLDDVDRYEDAAQESSSSCVTKDDDDSIIRDLE